MISLSKIYILNLVFKENCMELKWKTCFRAVVTVLVIYVLINYWNSFANIAGGVLGAVIPLIVGGIMAYAVNILMSFYENIFSKISLLVSKNKANNNTNGNTQKKSVISSLKRPFCMILAYCINSISYYSYGSAGAYWLY